MALRFAVEENAKSVMLALPHSKQPIWHCQGLLKAMEKGNLLMVLKLKGGMLRALEKRPLSAEEVDAVFGSILTEIRQLGEREIASRQLGEIVMRNLKRVDQVAYVRFASVYRDFQDIKEFAEEISSLSKEKPKTRKKKK